MTRLTTLRQADRLLGLRSRALLVLHAIKDLQGETLTNDDMDCLVDQLWSVLDGMRELSEAIHPGETEERHG